MRSLTQRKFSFWNLSMYGSANFRNYFRPSYFHWLSSWYSCWTFSQPYIHAQIFKKKSCAEKHASLISLLPIGNKWNSQGEAVNSKLQVRNDHNEGTRDHCSKTWSIYEKQGKEVFTYFRLKPKDFSVDFWFPTTMDGADVFKVV